MINLSHCPHEYVLIEDPKTGHYQLYYVDVTKKVSNIEITDYERFCNELKDFIGIQDVQEAHVRSKQEAVLHIPPAMIKKLITENSKSCHTPKIHPLEVRAFSDSQALDQLEQKNHENQSSQKFFTFSAADFAQDWSKEEKIEKFILGLKQEVSNCESELKKTQNTLAFLSGPSKITLLKQKQYLCELCTAMELREHPQAPKDLKDKFLNDFYHTGIKLLKSRDLYFSKTEAVEPPRISSGQTK